jgi:L-ascorbate metabolism protein UlaG (beta-lactamase superfamily)
MQVTYYGHSCFGLTLEGKRILLDPFITPNKLAESIQIKNIQADYILLSHAHEDHIADALALAQQTGALLIGSYEVTTWFEGKGITNVHPMNIGGQKLTDFGTIKMVNAVHSSTFADGTPGGNAAGFLIQSNGRTIYYAGDTALHYDMKFLGKFYKVDLAFLPIGDNFTMGVEDAIIASKFVKCDRIVGMHYDTFGYIKLDHSAAKSAFEDADKILYLMNIGETTDL